MKFLGGITKVLYTLIIISLGACLMLMAFNLVPKEALSEFIDSLYMEPSLRFITGFAGLLLIAIGLFVVQLAISKMERAKTIAFDNPDGQVTVSLAAIEDFMKRLVAQIPEIKELKPKVTASKKGIIVDTKLTLYSDTSIPNITEKVQSIVKNRIQDMLGIEEASTVRVHISKLVSKQESKKKKTVKKDHEEEVPAFRGIEYSEQ